MILVLIGYRGTGKSTVGKFLSKRLRIPYVSMDSEIEKRAGMTISEIVEALGWDKFRDIESEVVRKLSSSDNIVLDTGGGVIERADNIKELRRNSKIFWLKASIDTVASRIARSTNRPALVSGKTFIEEIAEVLERRSPVYKSAADYEIDTDNCTSQEVAAKILDIWAELKETTLSTAR